MGSQRVGTGLKQERGDGEGEAGGSLLQMRPDEGGVLLGVGGSGCLALCLDTSGHVLGRGLDASMMP